METKLKQYTDLDLIEKIRKCNCSESLMELSSRHQALCFGIYKKYASSVNASGISFVDLFKEKDYVVWQSAMNYDASRHTKFSTWLGNNIRYQCLNAINNNSSLINMDTNELNYYADKEPAPENNTVFYDYIFSILGQLKDSRIKRVFELRFFESDTKKRNSWSAIAKIIGVSTQTAINLYKRGESILKEKLKSDNVCDKI